MLDKGSKIEYGGESYKKFTTTTRINAREGVCATNLYRLLYNNSVAQRANAASSASTADDNWRKCSLISSISNTTIIDKYKSKKRGVSINAIATFKVMGSDTGPGYVRVDSSSTSSSTFGGLANIKPVAGLRISHAPNARSFDTKVRIWLGKDDDGNDGIHYTSYCEVYAEKNTEVDVIIFGTAMHERKANGQ